MLILLGIILSIAFSFLLSGFSGVMNVKARVNTDASLIMTNEIKDRLLTLAENYSNFINLEVTRAHNTAATLARTFSILKEYKVDYVKNKQQTSQQYQNFLQRF